jgi:thiol-disulfide isomerase/thioredoxin
MTGSIRSAVSNVSLSLALMTALAIVGCAPKENGATPEAEAAITTPAADAVPASAPTENSTTAKEIEVAVLDGAAIKSAIDGAKGKVTVVNFWATWCPPCVEEMPDHVKFYNEFGKKGVNYLSFSADDTSTIEDAVKPFAKKAGIEFPISVMAATNPDELESHLKLGWDGALPTTYLFDAAGAKVTSWVGAVSYADLVKAVTPLLEAAK